MEAMPSIPLGRASFPGTPIHLRIVESVVHSIVACSLLSFVPTQPRFTRSFMSAGSNRARCRETCSGSRKLKRPAPLCVAVRKRCFYVWLVQVPPGRRTTVGHAVRRTSPLISTLATAAAEMKCSLTRNCFDQTRWPIAFCRRYSLESYFKVWQALAAGTDTIRMMLQ